MCFLVKNVLTKIYVFGLIGSVRFSNGKLFV